MPQNELPQQTKKTPTLSNIHTYTQTVASRIARLRLIQSKLLFTNIFHFDTAEPTSKSKRSSLHHSRTLSLWEQDKSAEEMKTWKQDSLLGAPTWGAAACNACYHSLEQLIAISAAKYMSFYLFINIFRYFFNFRRNYYYLYYRSFLCVFFARIQWI